MTGMKCHIKKELWEESVSGMSRVYTMPAACKLYARMWHFCPPTSTHVMSILSWSPELQWCIPSPPPPLMKDWNTPAPKVHSCHHWDMGVVALTDLMIDQSNEPLLSIIQEESNCVHLLKSLIELSQRLKEAQDKFWPVQNLSPWLCLHQHFSAQERTVEKLTISLAVKIFLFAKIFLLAKIFLFGKYFCQLKGCSLPPK